MKILVTGSSGLIGRWIGQRLDAEGIEWAGIDLLDKIPGQGSSSHYQINLCDRVALARAFEEFQPTSVIHLAARIDLYGKSLDDYEVNRGGVEGLCEIINKSPQVKRIIVTSSQLVCKVGYVPQSDDEYCPHTVYGESKVETEKIVKNFDFEGIEWCLVRPTTVWGPYMSEHYQSVIRHVQNGRYFHSGSKKLYKSYAYAENIAHQYFQLLTADSKLIQGKTFYLADYEPLSLRDYLNTIADELGVRKPITFPLSVAHTLAYMGDALNWIGIRFPFTSFRLKNILTEYIFDLSDTEAVCGPLPKSFEEGVHETVEWFKSLDD
jgi:GlcNAc-P-P-Und epimerase